ncbi:UNVERIFIED_CONTAM: hypothetical protein PYX00_006080 [Menopon gallinae]|uniref:Lipase n=1 Tax=Menopon gallinae TaxID=328185 RepID=A0AAW2HVZ1_9NEOP
MEKTNDRNLNGYKSRMLRHTRDMTMSRSDMKILFYFLATLAVSKAADLDSIYSADELSAIDPSILEDARLDFEGLTKKYGYPSERHTVKTKDGYLLKVDRIPYGKQCQEKNITRVPVLFQHGLLSHSIDSIIMGPEKGLGYILADACFDVWISNSRGNRQSRAHVTLSTKDAKFWDFSWHELGVYDLPAVIDYIIEVTGQPSLHYIGHSQGTTQFFVFGSLVPEYSSKIRSAHMLSPVAYMKRVQSPLIRFLLLFKDPIQAVVKMIGLRELLPTSDLIKFLGSEICTERYPTLSKLCTNLLFLLCGFDEAQTNSTMIPVIAGHTPAGGSVKQLLHYMQAIESGEFRQYDHGTIRNLFKYGSIRPPKYPLQNIKIPVAFYFGDNDYLSEVNDMHLLSEQMPNLIGKFRAPWKDFNHLDFIWAIDLKPLLSDKIISMLRRY